MKVVDNTAPTPVDITPTEKPVRLIRDTLEVVEREGDDIVSAAVILLWEDDTLSYETCGLRKKDALWALEAMKDRLLGRE